MSTDPRSICTSCWFRACQEGSTYPPHPGCHCCAAGHYLAEQVETVTPDWSLPNSTRRWPQSKP